MDRLRPRMPQDRNGDGQERDQRREHLEVKSARERDFGLLWRGPRGATYRAAWVRETAELYVVRNGHPLYGGGTVGVADRRFGVSAHPIGWATCSGPRMRW